MIGRQVAKQRHRHILNVQEARMEEAWNKAAPLYPLALFPVIFPPLGILISDFLLYLSILETVTFFIDHSKTNPSTDKLG